MSPRTSPWCRVLHDQAKPHLPVAPLRPAGAKACSAALVSLRALRGCRSTMLTLPRPLFSGGGASASHALASMWGAWPLEWNGCQAAANLSSASQSRHPFLLPWILDVRAAPTFSRSIAQVRRRFNTTSFCALLLTGRDKGTTTMSQGFSDSRGTCSAD